MDVKICKATSKNEIDTVFQGDAPHYHPDEFWDTRMQEKRVLIAQSGDQNIGLLCYTIWWGNTPFLELVHIQDKFQRQGIARALIKEAAQDIQAKGFKTLISSCEIDNENSLSFHKALAFQKLNTLNLPHGEEQFFSLPLEKLF